jgi:branched-chain amino acid transport system permease protein
VLELVTISTLNGVLYGMLLFLMASGLTLIFSMMGVLNLAHASFYMLGPFFGFEIGTLRWASPGWSRTSTTATISAIERPESNR